jgi:hypothetical protein
MHSNFPAKTVRGCSSPAKSAPWRADRNPRGGIVCRAFPNAAVAIWRRPGAALAVWRVQVADNTTGVLSMGIERNIDALGQVWSFSIGRRRLLAVIVKNTILFFVIFTLNFL